MMTSINIENSLFVNDNSIPGSYFVETKFITNPEDSTGLQVESGEIPSETDDNGIFHLDLFVSELGTAPDEALIHGIDLGEFPFSPESNTLQINVKLTDNTLLTSGIVKSEDAQQDTR